MAKAMDQFRRHETSARDYLSTGGMAADGKSTLGEEFSCRTIDTNAL